MFTTAAAIAKRSITEAESLFVHEQSRRVAESKAEWKSKAVSKSEAEWKSKAELKSEASIVDVDVDVDVESQWSRKEAESKASRVGKKAKSKASKVKKTSESHSSALTTSPISR